MLFRTQVFAVITLTCGIPLVGQDQKPDPNPSTYREGLRINSEDPQPGETADSDASREVYKEQLRRLSADGDDRDKARKQGTGNTQQGAGDKNSFGKGTAPESKDKPSATAAQDSAEGAASETPAKPKSLEPVSLQQKGSQSSTGATAVEECHSVPCPPSPVSSSLPHGCTDAYCKNLGRVADGRGLPAIRYFGDGRTITTERNFIKNLAFDQVHIWKSPFKMRDSDATWAVPFGIVTGSLIATDRDVSKQLTKPSRQSISKNISDAGLFGFIGAGAGFYGLGLLTHDDHKRETGLLAGEAAINATFVGEAFKLGFGRQRPFEGDHFGHIGRGGNSFPSGHSIDSWAIATVFAHEYPNPFMQIAAYGLASAVSATRVTAGQHFPSDVLVGSTFGYLIGRKIYHDHHNAELDGTEYGTFVREHKYDAAHSGSAYVPLESWVYPVIDRLAALGFVKSNFDSERPFTRLECARLAAEAAESAHYEASPDVESMIDSLQKEFARESEVRAGGSANRSAELESIYTRVTQISGPVLRDGYHFGQTLYNDYGRPYGRGFNSITGFAARATSGPLVFYFRGEYQHAPANPSYTPAQQAVLSISDYGHPNLTAPFAAVDRFRVLDAYVGVRFSGNQLTLGQQSLWWGPGSGGPFIFTNNAAPLKMVKLNNVSPVELPGPLKYLGPLRYELFVGQTDGHRFVYSDGGRTGAPFVSFGPHLATQPFIQGQRFSFKPTINFEFGFSRTGIFGGTGFPLTLRRFVLSTFSLGNTNVPGSYNDPGDRRSGADITYRIPGVRDWLSFYLEEFSDDEISPLFVPRRSAMHPGIYVAKMPKFHSVDLRIEGIYTDPPSFGYRGFFYFNNSYLNGYTRDGNLLGNWIGREGRGVYATSTVWLSPKNALRFAYRQATVDREFVGGGRYQDESVTLNLALGRNTTLSTMLQYEYWKFALLKPLPQNNFASSVQITYSPDWSWLQRK